MGLTLIVTNAGRAALVNAANTGTAPVTVAQVGLTGTAVTPDATATALPGEFKRLATLSGDVVADDTIHLIVRDESGDVFTVRSLALYLADGTLFAIYGQADVLVEKSAQALMLLAIDVQFADVDAADLTFGDANFLNPPATTEVQGVVELTTLAEAIAGTDTARVPAAKMVKDAVYSWLDARFGVNNSGIWNPANDGAGSGLDADLLDGVQGADYARISQPNTFTSAGINLFSGTVESRVDLGFKLSSASPYVGFFAADRVTRNGYIQAQTVTGAITFHNDISGANTNIRTTGGGAVQINGNTAWHAGNDGAGSGLDADLWDGNQFTSYLNQPLLTSSPVRFGQIATASAGSLGTIIWGSQAAIPSGNTLGGLFTLDSVAGAVAGSIGLIPRQTVTASINFYRYNGTLDLTLRSDGVAEFTNTPRVGGSAIWHAGNDGAGSGLDADLLDGLNSSAFAQLSAANTFSGDLTVSSAAPQMLFNQTDGSADQKLWGFRVNSNALLLHTFTDAGVLSDTALDFRRSGTTVSSLDIGATSLTHGGSTVWTAANDGAGSGLDADLLDGLNSSAFAQLSATNTFTGNLVLSNAGPLIRFSETDQAADGKNWEMIVGGGYLVGRVLSDDLGTVGEYLRVQRSGATIVATDIKGAAVTINGSTAWTAANDGAGSGLDADLLDGLQGASYPKLGSANTFSSDNTFSGDILMGSAAAVSISGQGIQRSGTPAGTFFGVETNGNWLMRAGTNLFRVQNAAGTTSLFEASSTGLTTQGNTVWHAGNDGAGSGLDADLLDGQQGSYYLAASGYTAADVKAKLLTVDGSGSGIDADLLDGFHGGAYDRIVEQNLTVDGGYIVYASGRKETWGKITMGQDITGVYNLPVAHTSWVHPSFAISSVAGNDAIQQNTGVTAINGTPPTSITFWNADDRIVTVWVRTTGV